MTNRGEGSPRNNERVRFRVALAVFIVWVVALAVLAIVSGRTPVAKRSEAAATAVPEAPRDSR
jgi:hypothetical protein